MQYKVRGTADSTYSSDNVFRSGTSARIEPLTTNLTYELRVRAVNAIGAGPWSGIATATLGTPRPPTPRVTPATVPAAPVARVISRRATQILLGWNVPDDGGSAIASYDVQYKVRGTADSTYSSDNVFRTGTSARIEPLTTNLTYELRVRAVNAIGAGAWSGIATATLGTPRPPTPTLTPATTPDAPDAPRLVAGNALLTVSWTAPGNTGGSEITSYDVRWRTASSAPGGSWSALDDTSPANTLNAATRTATIANLINGTAYQVQVRAENAQGEGDWSPSATATPVTTPDAPVVRIISIRATQILLGWSVPANGGAAIASYELQYKVSGADDSTYSSDNIFRAANTARIDELTTGRAYEIRVRAINAIGAGAWSATASGTPATTPDAPAAPTLSAGDTELGVSWTAPSSDGGSAITDYDVEWKRSIDASWTDAAHSGTGTSLTLSALINAQNYNVRVRATNAQGTSAWSPTATAAPEPRVGPAVAPDAPTVRIIAIRATQILLGWNIPYNGGSVIASYDVQYKVSGGADSTYRSDNIFRTFNAARIDQLTTGRTYEIRVRAVNVIGAGPWSATASATPATTPDAPAAPTLSAGDTELGVSWTAPSSDGGSAITDYDVRWRAGSSSDWTELDDTSPSISLSVTISPLTNRQAYEVQVRAQNAQGESDWSPAASAAPAPPAAPTFAPEAPIVRIISIRATQILLGWSVPANGGSVIASYELQYKVSGADDSTYRSDNIFRAANAARIDQLTTGLTYEIRVRAVNAIGASPWSAIASATPVTTPDAPDAPTLSVGDTQLTVTWTAPSSDGGSAITDYDVEWKLASASDWTDAAHSGTGTSLTLAALTNGQNYNVRVRATTAQGTSAWSAAATATPATTPAAPVLRITATRAMQILLGWSVPANGGAAIASYELQYRVSGGADNSWRSDNIVHAADTAISHSANSARIDQLTEGLTYEMRVRAVNAIGAGLWSAIATASPAADPDGSMTVGVIPATAPDAPPAPSIVPGNLQVTAIWQAPDDGGDAIRTYIVQWKRAGAPDTAWSSANVHIRGTSATISGLEEGAKYDVRVRAMNQIGASPWSPVAQAAPSFTQRSARAVRANLARAGHVLAAGAVDVLGIRLVGEDDERRNRLSLAGLTLTPLPPSHAPSQRTRIHTHADEPAPRRVMGMAELLGRSNFELRLTPADAGQPSYQARLDPGGITLWGRGAMRGFQNETDTRLKLTGNAFSGWFGMDYAWRRATLGLAGSFNQSRTAFRSADAPDGDVTTRLGSFYPYLAIAPHERLRFWALAGFGWGSLAFEEKDAASVRTDLTMQVYAAGMRTDLIRSRSLRFSVKSDVSQAYFRTQAQPDLPAVQAEPGRFRLALESQLNINWNTASLSPRMETAMRMDYGDAASRGRAADIGMELGGGLLYQHRTLGLTLNARGRWLVLHQDSSAQEWGASFLMRVAPDTLGRGMQASLTPSWGRTQSERERLWRDDSNLGAAQPQETSWQPDRLSAELGYGVALWNERALITPFATWSLGESGGQTYGGGTRLKLGTLKLELTGEQQTSPLAPTDHRMSLHLSLPLGQ